MLAGVGDETLDQCDGCDPCDDVLKHKQTYVCVLSWSQDQDSPFAPLRRCPVPLRGLGDEYTAIRAVETKAGFNTQNMEKLCTEKS